MRRLNLSLILAGDVGLQDMVGRLERWSGMGYVDVQDLNVYTIYNMGSRSTKRCHPSAVANDVGDESTSG